MPPPNTPQSDTSHEGQGHHVTLPSFMDPDLSDNEARASSPSPNTPSRRIHQIDFRALDFVKTVDENLICPVCRSPFVDPVTTKCDHVFCRDCFEHSYDISPSCPIDRCALQTPDDLRPTHRIVLNQLDAIDVRCPNSSDGCKTILARSMVQNHVTKYCEYTLVPCQDATCFKPVPRRFVDRPCLHKAIMCPDCGTQLIELSMEKHRRVDCVERKMDCARCKAQILRIAKDAHEDKCPEAVAPCRWLIYGCTHRAKRKNLHEHASICNFKAIGPVVDDLKEELRQLRAEVQFLHERDKMQDRRIRFLECDRSSSSSSAAASAAAAAAGQPSMDLSLLPDAAASSAAEPGPYDSRDQYLLSLLEHQESKVDQVAAHMTELEAKQTMMLFNETIPIKEQMNELRSAQSTIGMHVRWLMNFRMQEIRPGTKAGSSAEVKASGVGGGGGGVGGGAGPSSVTSSSPLPLRRLSDTMRENITKL